MFVIVTGWHNAPSSLPLEKRIAYTMCDSAGWCTLLSTVYASLPSPVAITITSVTSAASFAIGCITLLPAVQLLCAYAAACISFNYIMQV